MDQLLTLSGTTLSKLIRNRKLRAAELVDALIQRVEEVNPRLNAIVCDRFERARKEALAADKLIETNSHANLPPFLGVPCSIKECFSLAGMPNSAGLVARKNVVAQEDAIVVARLRKAGAIPLGVTNTSELCMWMESNNKLYGRTNNPYNQKHTVGGSSGGEGAIIASGASPFGIGSDIGGSIRMPAFFNGVFGHKPSSGLVPNQGQYPPAENAARRYLCTGPLAKRAEDLMPLLRIFSGSSPRDEICTDMELGDCSTVQIQDLTVINISDNGRISVAQDLIQAQDNALRAFEKAGARVQTKRIQGLRQSLGIWSAMMSEAAETAYVDHLRNGKPFNLLWELFRFGIRRSSYTLPSLGLVVAEKLSSRAQEQNRKLFESGLRLRSEFKELLKPNTLILFPPYPRVAPRHNHPLRRPIEWQYTAIINVLELPATQVPLGLNEEDLPLGVQVIGGHGQDHICIAAAKFLEREFGGWVPPRL